MERPLFRDARVAFVILTWNSERFIGPCLDSVLALECHSLDVYVEENGSTDSTGQILERYEERFRNLHVTYRVKNAGTTVPRNHALRSAISGMDYVCVLDSDTVVNQEAFEIMVAALSGDSSLGVVGPLMADSAGHEQLSGRNLPTLTIKLAKAAPLRAARAWAEAAEVPAAPVVGGVREVGYLLSACWVVPASVFDEVGFFDEAIFYAPEDVDWCLRCWKAGYRVALVPVARIVHEYQRLSHQRIISRTNLEHLKGLAHYYRKHGYLFKAPVFGFLNQRERHG